MRALPYLPRVPNSLCCLEYKVGSLVIAIIALLAGSGQNGYYTRGALTLLLEGRGCTINNALTLAQGVFGILCVITSILYIVGFFINKEEWVFWFLYACAGYMAVMIISAISKILFKFVLGGDCGSVLYDDIGASLGIGLIWIYFIICLNSHAWALLSFFF